MPRIAQEIENNHSYTVNKEPLFTKDGTFADAYATRRSDNGRILGTVSDTYGIIQNDDAFGALEDAFASEGLTQFTRKSYVMRGGAAVKVSYKFDRQLTVKRVGDIVGLVLAGYNSHDGSTPLILGLEFERLVCMNGMRSTQKEMSLTKRHSGNIDISFIRERVSEIVNSAQQALELFDLMADVKLDQIQGENLITNLGKKAVFSPRVGEKVMGVWRSPRYSADADRNLYNVYNAVTQVATHELAPTRFELAQRVTGAVTSRFQEIVHSPDKLASLLVLNA